MIRACILALALSCSRSRRRLAELDRARRRRRCKRQRHRHRRRRAHRRPGRATPAPSPTCRSSARPISAPPARWRPTACVEAIRPHQLIGIDTRGLDRSDGDAREPRHRRARKSRRASRSALAGQYGLGEARNISVDFDRDVRARCRSSRTRPASCRCSRLTYDPRTTRFDVTFDLPAARRCTGSRCASPAPRSRPSTPSTVQRPMEHGEVLKESDLAVERRPKTEMPRGDHRHRARRSGSRRGIRCARASRCAWPI